MIYYLLFQNMLKHFYFSSNRLKLKKIMKLQTYNDDDIQGW